MLTIKISEREFEFVLEHLLSFARVDMAEPLFAYGRTHYMALDSLLKQAPKDILTKVITEEASHGVYGNYSDEQIAQMIEEAA